MGSTLAVSQVDTSRESTFSRQAPLGLAVLLGHRWNRVKPTAVYEEIPSEGKYEPAFEVQA
ncbi:MAG: SMODS-associated and fused to various effectors sensor domain [Blastocatellia bacterium]|nr:SMODS-associated and fused to various effectors sensor domain [Blastocatellia bacterium]